MNTLSSSVSGDDHAHVVPASVVVMVASVMPPLALPKSVIFATPFSVTTMLADLRS